MVELFDDEKVEKTSPTPNNSENEYVVIKLLPYEYHMLLEELNKNLRIINRDDSASRHLLKNLAGQGGVNLILSAPYKPEPQKTESEEKVKSSWWKFG